MANRPPLVARMNPLPMELAPALRERRRALASVASGRVLDLGGWSDHLDSYRIAGEVDSVTMLDHPGDVRAGTAANDPEGVTRVAAEPEELSEFGHGPFDTIVSLIRTPLVADLNRFLRTLTELLADEGRLLFLEPVVRAGRTGRLLALGGRLGRAVGGLRLDWDLPAEIRAAGMTITDLHRFEVPTVSAPFRPFVEVRVRRPLSPPVSAPVSPSVSPPVSAPVDSSVSPSVSPPVSAPVDSSVNPSVSAPVDSSVSPPVSAPVSAPVDSSVSSPES
ncbi:MAG: hypothetical protein KTV16_07470 [Acidimicrobiia bacterium]|nr:hypothetical protein [Acidimicrobiia bacterium]